MSAQILLRLVPRRLPVWYRYSSSSSTSSSGKGSAGTSGQRGDGGKPVKEPMKPFEQPKTSGAAAESKPSPPPPREPFDNSKYQVGELYQYSPWSFYDIESSLSPLRCPVPSSIKKPT